MSDHDYTRCDAHPCAECDEFIKACVRQKPPDELTSLRAKVASLRAALERIGAGPEDDSAPTMEWLIRETEAALAGRGPEARGEHPDTPKPCPDCDRTQYEEPTEACKAKTLARMAAKPSPDVRGLLEAVDRVGAARYRSIEEERAALDALAAKRKEWP